jgi:putative membrane protein
MLSHAAHPNPRPFRENRFLQVLGAAYALVWAVTAIRPLYPGDWRMENLLVVLAVAGLAGTYRRFPLSDLSYLLIAVFLALHAVGAHYTYANVPLGFWMKAQWGLARNPFDRIVHFSFGLLLAYPVREVFMRVARTRGFWNYYLPLDVVLAASAVYEIIESITARLSAPELGDAFLGTQGDIWDAQKDMTAAAVGAALTMLVVALVRRMNRMPEAETEPGS